MSLFVQHNPERHFEEEYYLLQKMSQGVFGSVYKAIKRDTQVVYAVKKPLDDNDSVIAEANILKQLQHPHIVRFVDFFNSDAPASTFLVMEFCTGGELYDFLTEMKHFPTIWSENLIKKIIFEIMSAIDYCHSKGIAHGDLKPQNIMVKHKWTNMGEFPSIKIVDFGAASPFDDNLTMKGSPLYMAPDLFHAAPYDYKKADNWAIGIILYEILYGEKPFQVPNIQKLVLKFISFQGHEYIPVLDEIKDVSPGCLTVLKGLLAMNPTDRSLLTDTMSNEWFSSVSEHVRPEYVLERLKQYTNVERFRRRFYHRLVHDLPDKQKQKTVQLFRTIAGAQKRLTIREMHIFVCGIETGLGIEIEDIPILRVDLNGNHMIDVDEFSVAMLASIFTSKFHLIDFYKGYSDVLTPENVMAFFGERERGLKVFMQIDSDGSGVISQDEFIQWLMLHSP